MSEKEKKEFLRRRGERWCKVEIELKRPELVLSICGEYGRAIKRAEAKKQARELWENLFEEDPGQLGAMQQRFPDRCLHTPKQGARFVVESDGEFHGLDVVNDRGAWVDIEEGCGQCVEEIADYFPEVAPYLKWHLNDLNAGCEHQEALGWRSCLGYHKPGETCPEPRELPEACLYECGRSFPGGGVCNQKPWKGVYLGVKANGMTKLPVCPSCGREALCWRGPVPWGRVRDALRAELRKESDRGCDYDAIKAPCPVCGYRYGTAWLKRELPAEVVAWFDGLVSGRLETLGGGHG